MNAIVLDAPDNDIPLAVPDTQSDSDTTESIAPRKIDNTDDDDSIAKSDRFWRMESDTDIAAKAALLASRSPPAYAPRTDNQRLLSLRIDALVDDWERTKAKQASDLETQQRLNATTSKQLVEQRALCDGVRADLAEQQQANAELISANNDLHTDCFVAQKANRVLTARIDTLTELCHDTDTRVASIGSFDDRLLLLESHAATRFTTETISDTMSNLLMTLTEAASTHQEDIDAIA